MGRSLAATIAGTLLAGALDGGQVPATPRMVVTSESRSMSPGELIVLTIVTPRAVESIRARAFGRELLPFRINENTWRVLVGIDLETATGRHEVTMEAGSGSGMDRTSHRLFVTARTFPRRSLTVDDAFVNPPPEAVDRIARETAELNDLWAAAGTAKVWDGPFVRPVPDPANSAFGTRTTLNGQPRSPHGGADFNSAAGTPIKAPNGGRVILTGDRYFTGSTVVIDHGLTLFSLFAHLSTIDVRAGDLIHAGDVVGKVGATGRVTGPHLHWGVRLNGARVDPLSLLAVLGPQTRKSLTAKADSHTVSHDD